MPKNKVVLDTNVLMNIEYVQHVQELISDNKIDLIIPICVANELDNHNHGNNDQRKYKARQGLKLLRENENLITFDFDTYENDSLDMQKADNKIIMCAVEKKAQLLTLDMTMRLFAKKLGVELFECDLDNNDDKIYKGYRIIEIDNSTEDGQKLLAHLYESPEENVYELYPNEYLIIRDTSFPNYNVETDEFLGYSTIDILKWNGEKHIKIKTPPKKIVSALNDLQKCALDLLLDKDTPIKMITGVFGSGKTLLSTRVGVHLIEDKGNYGRMYMVRNPVGSGEEIGFLPGSKEEKVKDFFKPIMQHFPGGEFQVEEMFKKGSLEMNIPYYMKGLSIGDAFIIVDECEDLDTKTIKLIGSRLEKNSCMIFCGDHKQAEKQFIYNSGMLHLAKETKESNLTGVVTLDLDVRSDASKLFADL